MLSKWGVNQTLSILLFDLIPLLVTLSLATVLLWTASPLLAVFMAGWSAVFIGVCYLLARRSHPLAQQYSAARSTSSGKVVDAVSNLANIRLFARHAFEHNYLGAFLDKEVRAAYRSLGYMAIHRAGASEFIESMEHGYESLVGERGVKLSGGQRQRIAIARVLLKNAPILVMDEATSSLDSITERFIQDKLDEIMHGKTVVVVAHRLSTVAHLDRILVFDNGRVIEDGSHEQLLSQGGQYYRLWNRQFDEVPDEVHV